MNKLRQLITEIHRRSVWQVLGVYVVGAWFGYEVVLSLTEGLGLPEWVPPAALILFIIGLPIVLATAMVQEGLPGTGDASARRDRPPTAFPPSGSDLMTTRLYVALAGESAACAACLVRWTGGRAVAYGEERTNQSPVHPGRRPV